MEESLRIAFVWYWNKASETYPFWRDGLRAALEEIEKEHTVDWFFDEKIPEDDYDFILLWGDSNCPAIEKIESYKARKGIILTTDPHNIANLKSLDVIYCESEPIYEAVRQHGLRAIKAFGTDTDFYCPDYKIQKDIVAFYPATFSPWKRQSEIANMGDKLLCVGTIQPDGQDEYQACVDAGVRLEVGYFPAEKIRDYYRRSQQVYIPAIHGSERTCLEAMACGITPIVNPNNKRTHSYITEFLRSGRQSQKEFVEVYYSHRKYAKELLRGMNG